MSQIFRFVHKAIGIERAETLRASPINIESVFEIFSVPSLPFVTFSFVLVFFLVFWFLIFFFFSYLSCARDFVRSICTTIKENNTILKEKKKRKRKKKILRIDCVGAIGFFRPVELSSDSVNSFSNFSNSLKSHYYSFSSQLFFLFHFFYTRYIR